MESEEYMPVNVLHRELLGAPPAVSLSKSSHRGSVPHKATPVAASVPASLAFETLAEPDDIPPSGPIGPAVELPDEPVTPDDMLPDAPLAPDVVVPEAPLAPDDGVADEELVVPFPLLSPPVLCAVEAHPAVSENTSDAKPMRRGFISISSEMAAVRRL